MAVLTLHHYDFATRPHYQHLNARKLKHAEPGTRHNEALVNSYESTKQNLIKISILGTQA